MSVAGAKSRNRKQPPLPDPGGVFFIIDQVMRYRRLMTVPELAPLLNVSDDVLYAMVRRGDAPPPFVIPGSTLIRFEPATVCYWLRKHNPILKQVQRAS